MSVQRRSDRLAAKEAVKAEPERKLFVTINALLELCDNLPDRKLKAGAAATMMQYIATKGRSFTKKHLRFYDVVVYKAHDLKRDGDDLPDLVSACDHLLAALGEPSEQQLPHHLTNIEELDRLITQLVKFKIRV